MNAGNATLHAFLNSFITESVQFAWRHAASVQVKIRQSCRHEFATHFPLGFFRQVTIARSELLEHCFKAHHDIIKCQIIDDGSLLAVR